MQSDLGDWLFNGNLTIDKVHPQTGHEGAEMGQRNSSILSLTWALNGSGWSVPRLGQLTPKDDLVPIVQEAG